MNREASFRGGNPWLGFLDHRVIAEIRLLLALVTLAALNFIPPHGEWLIQLNYGVIAVYILSALVLYWVALNRPQLVRVRLGYWLDAGWLLTIISLSGHSGSPLFLLLLFPILVAAAQSGFVQGMVVLGGTTLAYLVLSGGSVGGLYSNKGLLLQAGTLLTLGLMVSRWASAENHLIRKMAALSHLGVAPGLRDDADAFWGDTLKELAVYFGAESAFFLGREDSGSYRIHEYEIGKPAWNMELGDEQAKLLADVPEHWAIAWCTFLSCSRFRTTRVVDLIEGKTLEGVASHLRELAQILESRCWLSFPLHSGSYYRGRVFLLGNEHLQCRQDWRFIQQLAIQISLKWENLLLARQITRIATSGERERISRDLHDGTVQPYLGLKFGLEALRRKVPDSDLLAADIDELVSMTDSGILQLRGYIRDLRSAEAKGIYPALTMIRAQVQQFEDYSGLKVEVHGQEFELDEHRLFEIRQIIAEGLSNIRRHSSAQHALLDIVVEVNQLRIDFLNPVASIAPPFLPRSLTERAMALGGQLEVMRQPGQTLVRVLLPLWTQEKK